MVKVRNLNKEGNLHMKFIAYDIREDEKPYATAWSKEHGVEVTLVPDMLTKDSIEQAKGYDGVIAYQQLPYDKEIFPKMKEYGIKYLSIRNVGVDNIPADAVIANGITVTNVPSYSPESVAELEITGLMMLLRRMPEFDHKIKNGDLRWAPDIASELHTMTVGVYGTGRIGRAAINIFRGFGANVIGYDIFKNPELERDGIYVDTLDELFEKSDVISLHAPSTKENYHVVNADMLNKMKDGSYITNTARGDLIDTQALLDAYHSHKLAGAVLDVYENEVGLFNSDFAGKTIPDPTLVKLIEAKDIILTPHIAFYTKPAVKNMIDDSFDSMENLVKTGTDQNIVDFSK